MGSELAKETDLEADFVVPVPTQGSLQHWAMLRSPKKFELGLIRNHYVGRTL